MAMPKRDFYEILGVPPQAAPGEIKRAYRRIALELHPDMGVRSHPERFREAHEAYEILSDPERRRSYDVGLENQRMLASELPTQPVTIVHDLRELRPSLEGLLCRSKPHFFARRPKSGGMYRRLRLDAILEPEEAHFGCRLPLDVLTTLPARGATAPVNRGDSVLHVTGRGGWSARSK
jgi:curved DNA-binding protein CbpA